MGQGPFSCSVSYPGLTDTRGLGLTADDDQNVEFGAGYRGL
jgi:hypothetical protein